jgi:hypothetical protein
VTVDGCAAFDGCALVFAAVFAAAPGAIGLGRHRTWAPAPPGEKDTGFKGFT